MNNLINFLFLANRNTYATGDSTKNIKEKDGSTTLIFKKGDYKFHDNYFGGEPFGGREVIFYKNKPVWMMVYYGRVVDKTLDVKKIYEFLQKSLMRCPEDKPFRGPEKFKENEFEYGNKINGSHRCFNGSEEITFQGKKVYEAKYVGGEINK